eukprot:41717_1
MTHLTFMDFALDEVVHGTDIRHKHCRFVHINEKTDSLAKPMALEDSISSTLPTTSITTRHDEFIKSLRQREQAIASISDVLSNTKFTKYLLFNFLFIGSSFLPSVFIVDYGARWFAGCNPNSSDICIDINYTTLNFYQSLSTSMKGAIAFLFAGFVGRLSDAYGRKIFLIAHPILYSLQILPLIFANNFLWYLLLTPCAGLVGASLGLSPMMSAYISDVLPCSQRTLGFAVSYGSAGVALLTSAIISLMVSLYMSDYINFVLILVLYCAQTIYIWLYIPESLDEKHIKPLSAHKLFNPLRPLLQIRNNRIVFWISIVQFLITFMEVGILNICMVYILTELNITDNTENFLLMFTFIISVSFGLFIATAGVVPMSRKYRFDCLYNMCPADDAQSQMSEISVMTPQQRLNNTAIALFNKKKRLNGTIHTERHKNVMRMPAQTWVDFNNLMIGTLLSCLSLLGIGSVRWIHSTIYIGACGIIVGCAVGIVFPSANGVATNSLRNDEQGKGFGIIYAVKGITSAIAPFAFGTFYTYLVQRNLGPIIFLIGMILTFCAFIIIIFPLRWVLCDQQNSYLLHNVHSPNMNRYT